MDCVDFGVGGVIIFEERFVDEIEVICKSNNEKYNGGVLFKMDFELEEFFWWV